MLGDTPLRDLLAAFASPSPTPGGGGATALAAAVGVSLLQMVSALPKTRSGTETERTALRTAAAALAPLQAALIDAIDADALAYGAVVAAHKQPKGTDAEREARQIAIQLALRRATESPLSVMRLAAAGLGHAAVVGAHGHVAAAGEVGVAVALLRAGLEGARLSVEIDLDLLRDAAYKADVVAEVGRLMASVG